MSSTSKLVYDEHGRLVLEAAPGGARELSGKLEIRGFIPWPVEPSICDPPPNVMCPCKLDKVLVELAKRVLSDDEKGEICKSVKKRRGRGARRKA